jgi:predicted HTH transcriptional regulator
MLKLEAMADLERLINDEVLESLKLEYKGSASLGRKNDQRNELFKDVSAFANSASGQIVYGIQEIDRKPVGVDEGSSIG